MKSPFLKTDEAADYLRLSPRTLECFRVRGGGPPFVALGRRRLYRIADLDAWAGARRCYSTSELPALGLEPAAAA